MLALVGMWSNHGDGWAEHSQLEVMAKHAQFAFQLKGQRRKIENDIYFLKNTHVHTWLINFLLKFCVELKQGRREDCQDWGRGSEWAIRATCWHLLQVEGWKEAEN